MVLTCARDAIEPKHRRDRLAEWLEPILEVRVAQQPAPRTGILGSKLGILLLVVGNACSPQPSIKFTELSAALSIGDGFELLVSDLSLVQGGLNARQVRLASHQVPVSRDAANQIVKSRSVRLPGRLEDLLPD